MFQSKTSKSIRDLIQIHKDNPGKQEFDIKLIGSSLFDRLVYKKVTILKHKVFFSGFRSKTKEILFLNIVSLTRKHREEEIINLISEKGDTIRFRFKNKDESRKFFDIMGYYLSVDPIYMT